jgi:hypothetical protein
MSAEDAAAGVEEVIDCWFGEEASARREALIAKLAARPR